MEVLKGSVKDLVVLKNPEGERPGRGIFRFSNRYSVFDWGEMPDHIEDKGKSLCVVAAYFFEKMREKGILTHYIGVRENGKCMSLKECSSPPDEMEVKLVRVIHPELKGERYDYSAYKSLKSNYLIPLEIIYRNALPKGSSIFKRLQNGSLTPQDLGLDHMPEEGESLPLPYFDLSTKLESRDRYVSFKEAQELAHLSEGELEEMKEILFEVARLITSEVKKLNLENDDGKIELARDENGRIMVVDVVGTLDECRFSWNRFGVSKELLRQYYRQTPWFNEVQRAKAEDSVNWKSLVTQSPPTLPHEVKNAVENLYRSFANDLTEIKWFKSAPPFEDAVREVREIFKGIIQQ